MELLKIVGTQEFMGKTIPIVVGGFGPDTRCICDKTLADIHGQTERAVRKAIGRNSDHFRELVDYIDLKKGGHEMPASGLLDALGYSKQSVTQAEHIYLFSESGYLKLSKIMNSTLSGDVLVRLVDEYFHTEKEARFTMPEDQSISETESGEIEQKTPESIETGDKISISVVGRQPFMNTEIPIVLGGFGPGAKCICDKTVADLHQVKIFHVRELLGNNFRRFIKNVDYIDAAQRLGDTDTLDLLTTLGYAKQSITQAEHIYILSERGYAKLVKIMDTDQAWDIYNHLLDEYFLLREIHQQQISPFANVNMQQFSPELQLAKTLLESMMRTELQLQQQEQKIAAIDQKADNASQRANTATQKAENASQKADIAAQEAENANQKVETVNQQMEDMRQVIAISPTEWRKETKDLISKIAQARGNDYSGTYLEIFDLVEQRAGVSLMTRLKNKRRRMAEQGVDAAKCKSVSRVDVIADDKKLVEIYIAMVKEVAIRYGIGVKK